eukprot:1073028-Amphidinium_carterae.1
MKTITLDVKASDTIYNIRGQIQAKEGIPSKQQSLTFNQVSLLHGQKHLKAYGIEDKSRLTLVMRAPKKPVPQNKKPVPQNKKNQSP